MGTKRLLSIALSLPLAATALVVQPAPSAHALDPVTLSDAIGDFERDGTVGRDWLATAASPNTITQDTVYKISGARSLRVADTSTTADAVVRRVPFAASAGRTYRGQGWAMLRTGTPGTQALYLEFYDASGKVLGSPGSWTSQAGAFLWSRVSVQGVAPAGTVKAALVIKSTAAGVSSYHWDGVTSVVDGVPNGSFESAPTSTAPVPSWTASAGASTVTGGLGTRSARLTDTSTTASATLTSTKLPAWGAVAQDLSFQYRFVAGSSAMVRVTWYTEAGASVGTRAWALPACATGTWCTLRKTAQAPATATRAVITFATLGSTTSTVDIDSVNLTMANATRPPRSTITNLGTPLAFPNTDAAEIFAINGIPKLATVVSGYPARFEVVDIATNKVETDIALPGTIARSFAVTVDRSNRVYLGTNSKNLYRWTPGATTLQDLGAVPGTVTSVFSLDCGPDGSIYGGTYDPSGGRVFSFNPSTSAFKDFGVVSAAQDYVRYISVDKTDIFAGVGSDQAGLFQVPIANPAAKTQITLPETVGTGFVGQLDTFTSSNGKRFLQVALPAGATTPWRIYDIGAKAWNPAWALPLNAIVNPAKTELYMSTSAQVHHYSDALDKTVSGGRPGIVPGRDSVALDGVRLGGETTAATWIISYDPATASVRAIKPNTTDAGTTSAVPTAEYPITLKPAAQQIKRMAFGAGATNTSVYLGGFGGSSMAAYDPVTKTTETFPKKPTDSFGELEGFGSNGGYVYMGTYTDAGIWRFDPKQPWALGTNPVKIATLGTSGQDRPIAWASSGSRTYFGTVPKYGQLGGGIGILTSPTATPTFVRNVVQDQSVTTIAANGNVVYGGTSRWGGLGSTPTATSAMAFAYDTATQKRLWTWTPPAENGNYAQVVTMTRTPEGRLFATVGDILYELDPANGQQVGKTNLTVGGVAVAQGNQQLGTSVSYSRGFVFVRQNNLVYVVNPDTQLVTVVDTGTASSSQLISSGDKTYYSIGTNLYSLTTTL